MYFTSSLPYLLAAISLASRAQSQSTALGFTYPKVANASVPDVSNLTVHTNDSMIVEYTKFAHTTAIGISLTCYDTLQHALGNNTADSVQYPDGPYENTGRIEFNFSPYLIWSSACEFDGNSSENGCPEPDQTYCRFQLFNESIISCSWGPWGLGGMEIANRSIPLYFSPILRVKEASTTTNDTKLWVNPTDKTTTPPASATVNVTCPATGIPSQLPQIFTQDEDIWPPMADNLNFPIFPIADYEGDELSKFNDFGLSGGDGSSI